jgi:hypothetical protein
MTAINKSVWKVGHVLSRKGLIAAACQMRDISQAWEQNPSLGKIEATQLLNELYLHEKSIDYLLWRELCSQIDTEELKGGLIAK